MFLPEQTYQLLKLLTEFQNIMNENSQKMVNEICIENIEMRKENVTTLVTSLCGRSKIYSISSVNFINTNLCGESILCPYYHRWSKVTICHNWIGDMNSALCLYWESESHTRSYFLLSWSTVTLLGMIRKSSQSSYSQMSSISISATTS